MSAPQQETLHKLTTNQIRDRLTGLTPDQRFDLIKIQDNSGGTALHYAHPEEIAELLDGLTPDQRVELAKISDSDGYTTLCNASPEEITALLDGLTPDQRFDLIKIQDISGCNVLDISEPENITALLEGLSEDDCLKIVPAALKKTTGPDHAIALTSKFNTPAKMGQALFTEAGEYRLDLSEPEEDANIFLEIIRDIPDSRGKEELKEKFFAAAQKEVYRQAQSRVGYIQKSLNLPPAPNPGQRS